MNTSKYRLDTVLLSKPNAQHGGALLVALIIIFMLTLLGISSMRGATMEKRMAANAIQSATTFQGAESVNELALNDTSNLSKALNKADIEQVASGVLSDNSKVKVEYDLQQGIDMDNSATVQFVGTGPAYGYSAGLNSFVGYMYVVQSEATVESIRASGSVTQGAYRIAPSP